MVIDDMLYPNPHGNQVQQQVSWLQQQLSDQLPSSAEDIEATLSDVKQSGSSAKQTAADTLGKNCITNNMELLRSVFVCVCGLVKLSTGGKIAR